MSKIVNVLVGVLLLVLIVFSGVQTYRNDKLIQSNTDLVRSVEQYRFNFELARRTNERYADTFREADEANRKLGECLSEHISTLSQLRSQLTEVRAGYEKMQKIFESMADLGDNYNDSYDSGGGN